MGVGDSKTAWNIGWWPGLLADSLNVATGPGRQWHTNDVTPPPGAWELAEVGYKAYQMAATIDARLALYPNYVITPTDIMVNFGANDAKGDPGLTTYETHMAYIVDALHTKWPAARIWLSRAWRRGYAMSIFDTMATSLATIAAARSSYCFLGDDERVWLENGDDGATNTTDGVHYSAAGRAAKLTAMQTVFGF